MLKSWLLLAVAIALELCGTLSMKQSDGFKRPLFGGLMIVCYIASLSVLTLALKKIPVSVAYAIWSGVGTALISFAGVVFFREAMTPLKVAAIALIIVGVVLLNLGGGAH
jgi:small multidrug resistance pump